VTIFILAVDHRDSLRTWLGSLGVPAADTDRTARSLKTLCVRALDLGRDELDADEMPMLLLDEEYGVDAITEAKSLALQIVVPVERSGQAEFLFEHGDDFRRAIEAVDPDAVKALVRYNPAGDAATNRRSRSRLVVLQEYLRGSGRRFMLELLVPATAEQRAAHDGDRFDEEIRPALTATAIEELASEGLRPDWWKLEGNREPGAAVVVATAAAQACDVGCLVLGRGQDRDRVIRWVQTAAAVEGFVGFAVGRMLGTDPFKAVVSGEIDEREAAGRIAAAYLDVAAAYRRAQPATPGTGQHQQPTFDARRGAGT
jgi:myo-inositol catabolism protein IolC